MCEKGIRCEFCHFRHPGQARGDMGPHAAGQVAKKLRSSKSVRQKEPLLLGALPLSKAQGT